MTREELDQIAQAEQEAQARIAHHVSVCMAAGCLSSRSDQVKEALEKEVEAQDVGPHAARCAASAAWGSAGRARWSPSNRRTGSTRT